MKRIQEQKDFELRKPFKKVDNHEQKIKETKKSGIIEKMSETIMQLKTNLMHIRSCVYFVLR